MSMSRKLTDEEKRRNKLQRQERAREKKQKFTLDERSYTILQTLRDAPNHPEVKYDSKYFAKLLKLSEPSIFRIIADLRGNDILQKKLVNGSYAIDPSYDGLYYSEDTKKNIALVASLSGLLQQFEGTPLLDSVKKLIYFMQPEIAKSDAVFSSGRVIVAPQMEYDINIRNWDKVYEAIQKNHKIRFRYMKPYTNNERLRIVWPYQLILENGSVYLWAYDEYYDLILMYDLNYLAEVIVLRDEFELPENYELKNFSGGGRLGAFAGDNIEEFKIRFTGYAKVWMKNHKLADDQTFEEDEQATTVTFTSSQFEKILELILSWGRQAEPLAPARLVDRWKDEILAMAELVKEK